MPPRPTINDVAELAHVSTATVSRVINARSAVDARTRALVWDAIRVVGYEAVRDPHLLSSIVVLAPKVNFNNNFWQQVAAGVLSHATQFSIPVTFMKPATPKDSVTQIRALRPRDGVLGVLAVAFPKDLQASEWIPNDDNTVLASILTPGTGHQVDIDMSEASRKVTQELIALGHRRIAIAINSSASWGQAQRLEGFLDSCSQAGITPVAVAGELPFAEAGSWLQELMALPDRPTALIGGTSELANLLWDALHNMGVEVPRMLSFVGYGHQAQFVHPRYNTISHPTKDLGSEAVRILRQAVMRPDRAPIKVTLRAQVEDLSTIQLPPST